MYCYRIPGISYPAQQLEQHTFAFFLRSQSDIPESDRYGLIGLVLGLKNRDLSLTTENLLKVEKTCIAFTCTLALS